MGDDADTTRAVSVQTTSTSGVSDTSDTRNRDSVRDDKHEMEHENGNVSLKDVKNPDDIDAIHSMTSSVVDSLSKKSIFYSGECVWRKTRDFIPMKSRTTNQFNQNIEDSKVEDTEIKDTI